MVRTPEGFGFSRVYVPVRTKYLGTLPKENDVRVVRSTVPYFMEEVVTSQAKMQSLAFQLKAARSEISKLHRQMNTLSRTVKHELALVRKEALQAAEAAGVNQEKQLAASKELTGTRSFPMIPIGFIESCFVHR